MAPLTIEEVAAQIVALPHFEEDDSSEFSGGWGIDVAPYVPTEFDRLLDAVTPAENQALELHLARLSSYETHLSIFKDIRLGFSTSPCDELNCFNVIWEDDHVFVRIRPIRGLTLAESRRRTIARALSLQVYLPDMITDPDLYNKGSPQLRALIEHLIDATAACHHRIYASVFRQINSNAWWRKKAMHFKCKQPDEMDPLRNEDFEDILHSPPNTLASSMASDDVGFQEPFEAQFLGPDPQQEVVHANSGTDLLAVVSAFVADNKCNRLTTAALYCAAGMIQPGLKANGSYISSLAQFKRGITNFDNLTTQLTQWIGTLGEYLKEHIVMLCGVIATMLLLFATVATHGFSKTVTCLSLAAIAAFITYGDRKGKITTDAIPKISEALASIANLFRRDRGEPIAPAEQPITMDSVRQMQIRARSNASSSANMAGFPAPFINGLPPLLDEDTDDEEDLLLGDPAYIHDPTYEIDSVLNANSGYDSSIHDVPRRDLNASLAELRERLAKEAVDREYTANASSLENLGNALGSFFGVGIWGHMRNFKTFTDTLRSTRDFTSFVFNILPAVVQAYLTHKFPSLSSHFLFHGTGWPEVAKRMDIYRVALAAEPTEELIREATAYATEAITRSKALVHLPFSHRMAEASTDFKNYCNERASFFRFTVKGHRPALIYFAGPPRIGKTESARAVAQLLATAYAGTAAADTVYTRVQGIFVEGLTHKHKVVLFNELFGSDNDTNIANVRDIMSIVDGEWAPQRAFAEKGNSYEIFAAVGASNYYWAPKMTGFENNSALDARRTLTIAVERNPNFPGFAGCTPDQQEEVLRGLTAVQKQKREFLRYYFINPHPPASFRGNGFGGQVPPAPYDPPVVTAITGNALYETLRPVDGYYTFEQIAVLACKVACGRLTNSADMGPSDALIRVAACLNPRRMQELPDEKHLSTYDRNVLLAFIGFCGIASAAAVGYACYRLFKAWRKEDDDTYTAQYGTRPRDLKNLRNPPNRPLVVTANSGANEAQSIFLERIAKQLVRVRVGTQMIYGILVDQKTLLTTYHVFHTGQKDFGDIPFELDITVNGAIITYYDTVSPQRLHLSREHGCTSDVCLVTLSTTLPEIRNIRSYFMETVMLPPNTNIWRYNGVLIEYSQVKKITKAIGYDDPALAGIVSPSSYSYTTMAGAGDCGSVIVAQIAGQYKVVGIHCATSNTVVNNGNFLPVPKTMLTTPEPLIEHVKACSGNLMVNETMPTIYPVGNFSPVGVSTKTYSGNPGTKLTPTCWNGAFPEYPLGYGISIKDNAKVLLEVESGYGVPHHKMPDLLLNYAVAYTNKAIDIYTGVAPREFSIQEILDVDLTTATGYGWAGHNRKELIRVLADNTREMSPLLKTAYDALEAQYDAGTIPPAVYLPSLKDEILPHRKLDPAKPGTRTFQIDSLEHYLLGRKYIGAFCQHIVAAHRESPIRIGLNIHSRDMHNVMADCMMMLDDDEVVDVDYTKYDRSLMPWLTEKVADVMDNFYQNKCPKRRAWLLSNNFCVEFYGRSCWRRYQGLSSGQYGTAEVNSICNLLFIASFFKSLHPAARVQDLMDNMKMLVYGDDCVLFPSRAAKDLGVNFNNLFAFLQKYDYIITPAEKNADPKPYVARKDTTFLKMRMLWSDELAGYVPYRSTQTICDHLAFCRDPSPAGQIQLLNAMLLEYFPRGNRVDNGEIPSTDPTFNEFRSRCCAIFGSEEGVKTYESILGDYTDMLPYQSDEIIGTTGDMDFIIVHANGNSQSTSTTIYGNGNKTEGRQDATVKTDVSPSVSTALGNGTASSGLPKQQATGRGFLSKLVQTGGGFFDKLLGNQGPTEDIQMDGFGDTRPTSFRLGDKPWAKNADQPTNWVPAVPVVSGALIRPALEGRDIGVYMGDRICHDTYGHPTAYMSDADEMSLIFFIRRYTVTKVLTISYASAGETLIASIDMSPFQELNTPNWTDPFNLSTLEFAAALYKYWRGGLRWKFHIFGPAPISGRVALCTSYGDFGADPGYIKSVTGPTAMWDWDTARREYVLDTPFVAPQLFKVPPYAIRAIGERFSVDMTSLGTLRVYLATKITTPNTDFSTGPLMVISIAGTETFETDVLQPCSNLSLAPSFAAPTFEVVHANSGYGSTVHTTEPAFHTAANRKAGQVKLAIPIKLQSFAAKWATYANYTVNTGTTGNIFALQHPADTLIAQARFAQSAMKLYKGDLEIMVFPRGNGWQGGAGYLTFLPYRGADTNIKSISALDGVYVDFSSAEPVSFTVPFRTNQEYFYASCPNVGTLQLTMLGPLQVPATGGNTVDLEVQMRWVNFESYIPSEIGDTLEIVHANSGSAAEVTTAATELVQQKTSVPPVAPVHSTLPHVPVETSWHFADMMKRPTPVYAESFDIAAGSYASRDLHTLIDRGPGVYTNDLISTAHHIYSLHKGDTIYDIIFRSPTPQSVHVWAMDTNSSDTDDNYAQSALWLPQGALNVWPSQAGATPHPNYAITSQAPVTTVIAPGHLRVVEPYRSPFRSNYTSSTITYAGRPDLKEFYNQTKLWFFAETLSTVDFTVYRQVGDSYTFGVFKGIPPMWLQGAAVSTTPASVKQMPDTLFP